MSKFKCQECGSDLSIVYITPDKHYSIDDSGNMERSDNNEAFNPCGDNPFTMFVCTNDTTHNIGESTELNEWMDTLEQKFKDEGIYDK